MDSFRESPLGQLIRLLTKNKYLLYQEERSDFVLPWQKALEEEKVAEKLTELNQQASSTQESRDDNSNSPRESIEDPLAREDLEKQETVQLPDLNKHATGRQGSTSLSRNTTISRTKTREQTIPWSMDRVETEQREAVERLESRIIMPQKTADGIILVDCYSTDGTFLPTPYVIYSCDMLTVALSSSRS